jgi:AcrR family transcriptional regulator
MARAAPRKDSIAPPRPSLREEHKRLTRTRIVEAGGRIFSKRGFGAATVEEIAQEAGVGRATFYLHFSSTLEVMDSLLEGLLPSVHGLYEGLRTRAPTREVVRDFVEGFFDFYAANREVLSASVQAEAANVAWSRRLETLSWQLVDDFAPGLGPKRDVRHVRALFLVHELDRLAYLIAVRGWEVDRKLAVRVLTEHWLDFLV